MVFSSIVFISIFLPAVYVLHTILPSMKMKNGLLLIASLLFYAYGDPWFCLVMIGLAMANYVLALFLASGSERKRRIILWAAILLDLGVLAAYKYSGKFTLPIGISFFTFQTMSYVIDVYRRRTLPQKHAAKLLLYISFFPQLIAGPIVKYRDISEEIDNRQQSREGSYLGIRRFIAGLSKKVLIANVMAGAADALFSAKLSQIGAAGAWRGAVCYMLQIYFDFSGYSDMAIGMGWMFGFHFKENFNYPYISGSIKEFWRRWHISLSSWFRDYLYIPLGGNRKGRVRTIVNRWIVFLATGIWHGANFTFLFWGAYHGFFLMLEELCPSFFESERRSAKALRHIYTMLVVLIGFVFFRAESIGMGFAWVKRMFTAFEMTEPQRLLIMSQLTPLLLITLAVAMIVSTPIWRIVREKLVEKYNLFWLPALISLMGYVLCMLRLTGGSYNPFIYFRF